MSRVLGLQPDIERFKLQRPALHMTDAMMSVDKVSNQRYPLHGGGTMRSPGGDPAGASGHAWASQGEQSALNLGVYWHLLLKHKLLILGLFLGALVIGLAATLLMTPVYTAQTTVQIDREAARIFTTEEVTPSESLVQGEEFFQTQYGLLRSRSLAERVIDSLGLARSDETLAGLGVEPPEARGTAAEQTARRRAVALDVVQANLSISPVRGSRLATIGYDNPNPLIAARIANSFADNYIQSNLERKFESSAYARQFLEDRISQTKARLEEAERELVSYASDQQIINIRDSGDGSVENNAASSLTSSNLVALNEKLAEARAVRIAAQERWRSANSSALMSLRPVLENQSIQRLTEQRALLAAEYEQKLRLYQPDYPEMVQLQARIAEADSQIQTIARDIRASIQREYQFSVNQESALEAQVTGLTRDVLDLRSRSIQYNILQRELDTTRTLYEGLLQRYKEVSVTNGVSSNNISIVDRATPPESPSKPSLFLNLALAAILGLGSGVLAAFVIEALDETLATPDDVENKLGLPVLAVIPLLTKGQSPLEALGDVRSSFSEAYYSLRTALQFSTPNGVPASLLVTSSRPAEGKSTTAYATALTLARLGRKVLLADGDLRNPSMHRVMGMENDAGMSNLLSGSDQLSALAKRTNQPNLDFIPCGPLPPNPAELWGGDRLKRVLEEVAGIYDHVVIDGPPVLGFADAPLLASAVNGTVFVLEARGTRRGQARGALRRLSVGSSHILGGVLTKFNAKDVQYGGYDYAYDYHYGPNSASTSRKPQR